jgi:large subunit ribosomal protein L25
MEKIKIKVQERVAGKPNQLRREKKIPATIYGQGEVSKNLQVDEKEFTHLPAAALSHIVELDYGNGKPTSALIKHVQRHAASNKILNVEFYKVRLDHKITIVVALKFVGAAGGVVKGGQLVESHMEAEIECLPNDIPDFIEVDLSKLEEIDDAIHFRDLVVSDKVKILNEPDDIVAKISEIREVVEEEPVVAEAAPAEGAEGAGEAAPGAAATPAGADKAAAPAAKPGAPAAKGAPATKEK